MATKANPGDFDAYGKAETDEPLFTLMGRDRDAPLLVDLWAQIREARGDDARQVMSARMTAQAMRLWRAERQRRKAGAAARTAQESAEIAAREAARAADAE